MRLSKEVDSFFQEREKYGNTTHPAYLCECSMIIISALNSSIHLEINSLIDGNK